MTGTILTYLKEYGGIPLRELPFNDVDSLILCQLAYLKFDGMVPDVNRNLPPVELRRVAEDPDREKLFSDERYEKANRELFQSLTESRRFGRLRLNYYINLIEKERETQFSAVTFFLEDGTVYVAFRGTDENIVGWKEDCNMAFLSPVPAQRCSVRYLNMSAGRFPGKFVSGGHSKGGNLAVYSAMNCLREVQDRIEKIYSMDGPGFRPEVLEKCGYGRIAERVVKLLPHSSLVGMLFEQDIRYRVVESRSLGLLQHDPYSWIVRGDHFVEARDLYQGRKFMDNTINEWLLSLEKDQLQTFVEALFKILEATEADNLIDMNSDKKKSLLGMAGALKGFDSQTVRMIGEALKALFEIAGNRVLQEINDRIRETIRGDIR